MPITFSHLFNAPGQTQVFKSTDHNSQRCHIDSAQSVKLGTSVIHQEVKNYQESKKCNFKVHFSFFLKLLSLTFTVQLLTWGFINWVINKRVPKNSGSKQGQKILHWMSYGQLHMLLPTGILQSFNSNYSSFTVNGGLVSNQFLWCCTLVKWWAGPAWSSWLPIFPLPIPGILQNWVTYSLRLV